MKVVPVQLYEHLMSSVRHDSSTSPDQQPSIKQDPEPMEVESAEMDVNANGQKADTSEQEHFNTFPEWKEFTDQSTQTFPQNQRRQGNSVPSDRCLIH